jgi:hypothetical protein
MCKEAVVAYFKALSWHLSGRAELNLSQDSRFPGQDVKPGPPEYEAGVLNTQPRHLVWKYKLSWKELLLYIICSLGDAMQQYGFTPWHV